MSYLSRYGVLLLGLACPLAAAYLGLESYSRLTRASMDRSADFTSRLILVTLAMAVPFLVTVGVAVLTRGGKPLTKPARVGLAVAALSLALTWYPISGLIGRARQEQNLALNAVAAPSFNTIDLAGNTHRLDDYRGKVVLLNIWATWCGPCRWEMPQLDRLYRELAADGLVVLGLSLEDADLQRSFLEETPVSYPLLTTKGQVPSMYTGIERFPAMFIVDRQGQLRPAPPPGEPFEVLEATVRTLLMPSEQTETLPPGD